MMFVLGVLWKVAVVAIPPLLEFYRRQSGQSRELQLLLALAGPVWQEVEAWKARRGGATAQVAEDTAFGRVEAARAAQGKPRLSARERALLREYWRTRSEGGHLLNGAPTRGAPAK
jgi:hypothetical protein